MEPQKEFSDRILVVIVLFNRTLENSEAFTSLKMAFPNAANRPRLFVFDNSPASTHQPVPGWAIEYRHCPTNEGVSKGYNEASRYATLLRLDWLLLLDQDTSFSPGLVQQYAASVTLYPLHHLFASRVIDGIKFLSPFRFRLGGGKRLSSIRPGIHPLAHNFVINSGMLISLSLFEKAGGFDERLPMDFSDIDFLIRVRKFEREFIVVDGELRQQFSGNKNTPVEMALARFKQYTTGSRAFRSQYGDGYSWLRARLLMRACKLTLRYRNLAFLRTIIRTA